MNKLKQQCSSATLVSFLCPSMLVCFGSWPQACKLLDLAALKRGVPRRFPLRSPILVLLLALNGYRQTAR